MSSKQLTKSEIVAKIAKLVKGFSYEDFAYICREVRKKLDLKRPRKEKKLVKLFGKP